MSLTASSHAQNPNVLRVARDLYATYCASSDGKNYQGLPCPEWDALTEAVRGHWYTVALRVCEMATRANRDGALGKTGNADAAIYMALTEPPSMLGHLPESAPATWAKYAGA